MPPLTALSSMSSPGAATAVARGSRTRSAPVPVVSAIEFLVDAAVVSILSVLICAESPLVREVGEAFGSASVAGHFVLSRSVLLMSLLLTSIVMTMLVKSKIYENSEGLLHIRETACVVEACLSSAVLLIPWAILMHEPLSSERLAASILLLMLALVVEKHIVYKLVRRLSPERLNLRRTVIFGRGEAVENLHSTLLRSPKSGLYPIACYDVTRLDYAEETTSATESPALQFSAATLALLGAHQVDLVLIDRQAVEGCQAEVLIEQCRDRGLAVAFVGESSHETLDSLKALDLDGQSIYAPHTSDSPTLHSILARTLDITVSVLMLVAVSMPALLIALIIRLESEGPILYRQRRVGHNGRLFTILKFRTMYASSCGDALTPATSSDPRITRSGRWLRKTSLDELPQLLNVLFGEMALVGPRPEMPFIVASYSERQRRRLSVRPGLTGIWQLSPHRSMPIHENMQYDLYYLRQRSFTIDIAILLHTVVRAMNGI